MRIRGIPIVEQDQALKVMVEARYQEMKEKAKASIEKAAAPSPGKSWDISGAPAKAAKKKTTASKPKKVGPSVGELIVKAVAASKDRSGVSTATLKKALAAGGYDVDKKKACVKTAIKSLVAKGSLVQTKGTGASGSFKMNKKAKKPTKKAAPKAKKPAAAKAKKPATAAKKPKKAAAAKKPTAAKKSPKKAKKAKKPAAAVAKKATKSPKKAAAKSPKKVIKKAPAAKKAPTKKAAKPKAKKAATAAKKK
ncbi:histone H1-like [Oreochromis aureus]|uniref:histone H1-like n=1 Tax=Oreochromis aureus TaxID=47969 RepID=UPI001954A7EF|nr:histone H1-like [Oreochromis aureus]